MDDLRELYEEIILDHNRNPRNYGPKPQGANRSAQGYNPLCGDEVEVHVRMEGDVVADVSFEGRGCAICTASASIMTEAVKGKNDDEVQR
ncbi:MAG: Fe-S cluster assembly sulfur transfer protein SufU, partial [Gammaproteobacteria bacterium]